MGAAASRVVPCVYSTRKDVPGSAMQRRRAEVVIGPRAQAKYLNFSVPLGRCTRRLEQSLPSRGLPVGVALGAVVSSRPRNCTRNDPCHVQLAGVSLVMETDQVASTWTALAHLNALQVSRDLQAHRLGIQSSLQESRKHKEKKILSSCHSVRPS